MTVITTNDVQTAKVLQNFVITETEKASAFQALSQKVNLTATGSIIPTLGQTDAEWIAEGAAKPVKNPELGELTIAGKKMAKIVYVTEEFSDNFGYIRDKIKEEAVASIARTFDKTVAGLITAPTGFSTLGGATTKVVTSYSSFIAAITPIKGKNVQIALNTQLLYQLKGIVNTNDVPVLTITDTHIQGIPYVLLAEGIGTTALGFVGPFASAAFWGVIPGTVKVKSSDSATIVDNGTVVNLWAENKVAWLVEGYFGFRTIEDASTVNEKYFYKFGTTPESGK